MIKQYSKIALLSGLFLMAADTFYAQNIAINGTGAAANTSAGLDVDFTTKGFLLPRMTAAQRAAIGTPATGLIVYQTDAGTMGSGFYFYNGAAWIPWGTNNGGWGLSGNTGTAIATNFLGTTDAVALAFRTTNTERMRILAAGSVVAHSTTAVATDGFSVYGTAAMPDPVSGYTTQVNGIGIWGQSTGASGGVGVGGTGQGTNAIGIYGASNNATGFGAQGSNSNASGTGILGTGNNLGGQYLVAGSGGAFTGLATAFFGRTTTAGTSQVVYTDNFGTIVRVNFWNGTQYKINGTGAVSCLVPDLENNLVTMHCPETPEFYYSDYGQGQLVNGVTHIELDPIFAKNIAVNEKHPLRVFIQLEDNENCKGVVIKNKTATGFDVVEMNGGTSNTPFQWNVVCNAADMLLPSGNVSKFADIRFEKAEPAQQTAVSETSFKKPVR